LSRFCLITHVRNTSRFSLQDQGRFWSGLNGLAAYQIYRLAATSRLTDHVFALCHLLGYRFAPRIRDLADKRLATIEKPNRYPALEGLIGTALNTKQIRTRWDEVLRLATAIRQGTVTASLMLRKLGAYPRQNGLALALRELGRFERSLFTLDYLKDVELRRRIHVGLNKGEARNALARAVFFNRIGRIYCIGKPYTTNLILIIYDQIVHREN
jgi:TnpA family transposase